MKIFVFIGTLLTLVLPFSAFAQGRNSSFNLRVSSGHFDVAQTYVAGPDRLLTGANVQVSLPAAVQLDEDVPADLVKGAGGSKTSVLTAGTILYVADNSQTTYCGQPWSDWSQRNMAPCLTDSDGDGRFDQGALNDPSAVNPPHLVLDNIHGSTLHGVMHRRGPVVTFPLPIAYHRIDAPTGLGSRVAAGIIAMSDFNKKTPGPVHFGFAIWQPGKDYFGSLFSEIREITYTGMPVEVSLFGIKLTVVGIDENGRPLCKLEGQIDDQVQPFIAQNVVEHIHVVAY